MPFNEIFLLVALVLPAVRETVAFGPGSVSQLAPSALTQKSATARQQPKQQWNRKAGTGLGMVMDPHDAISHAQVAADLLHDHGHHVTSQMESPFSTITTSSSMSFSEAKYHPEYFKSFGTAGKPHEWHYKWQIWKFHGPKIFDGIEINGSVPPSFGDTPQMEETAKYKDYFIPDGAEQMNAVKRQSAATLGDTSLNPEFMRDRTPGGKPEFFFDTPMDPKAMYAPLSAKDLDEIAHDGDIMSRLPMLAFASVLIDFFFFNSGNDIYRDEIVNDDEALRSEWVAQVVPRLGIGIVVALVTMWSSYTFYHPIPGV